MEKYINKGFDTLADLALFLNEREIPKDNIIHIGVNASRSGYQLIFVKKDGRSRL
jgi:hypothetical protein